MRWIALERIGQSGRESRRLLSIELTRSHSEIMTGGGLRAEHTGPPLGIVEIELENPIFAQTALQHPGVDRLTQLA